MSATLAMPTPIPAQNRTNVRSSPPSAPPLSVRLARVSLGALAFVAPALAGRRAASLFLTPPRFPVPERERVVLAQATEFPVYWRGGRIAAWAWEPLSHGAARKAARRRAHAVEGTGASADAARASNPDLSGERSPAPGRDFTPHGAGGRHSAIGRDLATYGTDDLASDGSEWIASVEDRRTVASGIALLVHGWGGRGGQLAAFVDPLRRAGYRVVAFDHPAHGASDGEWTNVLQMAEATATVASASGRVDVLVSHSLGGGAAVAAASQGLRIGRAALLAPPTSLRNAVRRFAAYLGVPGAALPHMEAEIGRRVGVDLDRVEVAAAARDVRTPTLVVHDVDDADVPLDEGRAVARALPAGELHITRGLGHRRILKDPTVIARAVEFLTA